MATVLTEQRAPAKADVATSLPSESLAPRLAGERFLSLDAYRGFIMLMLVSHGFGFTALRNHPRWGWLAA
ncbi:MAG: hypothetical protein L0312_31380, partial [Acidobacteria bacterium]|nr:hypothetical protein [Acidobacteriota bacterium]